MGVGTMMPMMPFDVVMGVPGNEMQFQPSNDPFFFDNNVIIHNRDHTFLKKLSFIDLR